MRTLELLSPAKNLECGIAAIDHGADAVYIGAQRFGARAAAGNSIEDIEALCRYAHPFGAKVYVTVNTLIREEERESVRQLLAELSRIQVDAILVQDMQLLEMPHPGVPYHASTQTDNRTAEKVQWLYSQGFRRVVLARELSVEEISTIHKAVPEVELEVFVHGALCVSYSGACYASEHCFGRSANRGECAQVCRMKFDLLDAEGTLLEHDRYLLSLKDLCQYDNLERLAEAGACSFKIEGRLKDVGYVKNVTAAYSQRLNELILRYPDKYCRASRGMVTYTFQPDLRKTFNRGYTTYFADGRQPDIACFDTPKAMGEYVGQVKEIRGTQSFNVAGIARFANGDGLCFLNDRRELEGFRVNRVEGNRLFPMKMPSSLRPGTRLYRNNDMEFERLLSRPSAERKLPLIMRLEPTTDGFALTASLASPHLSSLTSRLSSLDSRLSAPSVPSPAVPYAAFLTQPSPSALDSRLSITVSLPCDHQEAQKPQRENIIRQLTKLGGTPYVCQSLLLSDGFNYFIPSSFLSELRRKAITSLTSHLSSLVSRLSSLDSHLSAPSVPSPAVPYAAFLTQPSPSSLTSHLSPPSVPSPAVPYAAFLTQPSPSSLDSPLMQCRHCIRFSLGACVKNGGRNLHWKEPLYLRLGDGRRFRLAFDCHHCQMNVYAEDC